jgi:hypothetical protein
MILMILNIDRKWFNGFQNVSANVNKNCPYKVSIVNCWGHTVAQLVALRYKPEGRVFDSRWCHWNFSLT